MRAWYDIFQFGGGREDEAGLRASQKLVEDLIRAQGLPPQKIVLAGFSQGGAIVLQTGLRYPERLAGIMALSCYLPIATSVAAESSDANKSVPIFMAHGRFDDIIPMPRAQASREALEKMGYALEWHEYPMPHSVCAEEIAHISAFLSRVL
jgi:phospholipase/carboxylesterase